jgi:hypothetical protein
MCSAYSYIKEIEINFSTNTYCSIYRVTIIRDIYLFISFAILQYTKLEQEQE